MRVKDLKRVEEDWETFGDVLLRCSKKVCGVRHVGGCRRKGCQWLSKEVKLAVIR